MPRWSAKHPLLRVLLVLGCLVVTLGVAELVLRIVDYAELHVPPDNVLYGPDAELGWSLVPNRSTQSTSGNRTISVEINSLGLREREFTDARPGTFIFIGNSFTFGYDAEPNERFSDLLQQALPQYRMINAGVSGYGTDQQYLLLQRLWKHVRPQVVVLTVCVDNDRDDNSSSFRYRRYYKPYFARTPEGEWQVRGYPLPPSKRQLFTGNVWAENSLLVRFAIFSYIAIRHAEVIVPDPTEHLINMVRRTAEARGARLVVGLQRHEPRLEAYLRTQGIPFTSFDDAKGYPTAGWHWTPEGNAVVAARYLALFTELGIASSLAPPASESRRDRSDRPHARADGGDGRARGLAGRGRVRHRRNARSAARRPACHDRRRRFAPRRSIDAGTAAGRARGPAWPSGSPKRAPSIATIPLSKPRACCRR